MRTLLLISLLAAILPGSGLFAQSSKVSLTTKFVDSLPKPTNEQRREEQEKKKKKEGSAEKESRKISVTIRNLGHQAYPGALAKFYVFGRTAGEPGLRVLEQEEKPTPIEPGATVTVESKTVSATYTPLHTGKEGDKQVRVKAAGTKITGYGVKILEGDVVLGEFFTSTDAKDLADGKTPAKEPAAKDAP
jgi:hypothetical protein